MIFQASLAIGLLFTLLLGFIAIMRFRRFRRSRRRPDQEARRCRCGYQLANLEVPRCPECGLLIGFDNLRVSDLGMSEDELLHQARARRKKHDSKVAGDQVRG